MKNKKVNIFMAVLLVGAFAVVVTMGSAVNVNAKSDKAVGSNSKKAVVKKEMRKVEVKSQAQKKQEFKTYETATVTSGKGNGNAQVHQKKISEVTTELDAAGEAMGVDVDAGTMKKNGKALKAKKKAAIVGTAAVMEEVEEQEPEEVLEEVAEAQEEAVEETTEAIEEIESRGKVKKLFVGSDYKNLGQLRSTLVHNRNDIRKLNHAMEQTIDPEALALMETSLTTMMQERERIRTVITENEEGFSLFGWVGRFMTGYQDEGVEDWVEVEESLADIVAETIEESMKGAEEAEEAMEEDEGGTEIGEDDATEEDDATSDQTDTGDDDDTEAGLETTTDEDPADDTTGTEDPADPVL